MTENEAEIRIILKQLSDVRKNWLNLHKVAFQEPGKISLDYVKICTAQLLAFLALERCVNGAKL